VCVCSEDEVKDIQQEIAVLSQIRSPYVTRFISSRLIEGTSKLCIVMEYMAGGSVADLLAAGGPIDEQSVRAVCRDLCFALEYLHSEGKIHRDVKAANVLLTATGDVRLADFGVAAEVSRTLGAKRKTFTGTPFWMAPEVISQSAGAGGAGYDARADIWSLGITAYECATGKPPHAEEHPMRVLFIIPKTPPPALGPQFSKQLRDFVAFVLVKEPHERPSAKEVLKHRALREATRPSAAFLDRVAAAVKRHAAERAAADAAGEENDEGAEMAPDSASAYPTWDFGRKGSLGGGTMRRVNRSVAGEEAAERQAELLALGGTVRMPATPRAATEQLDGSVDGAHAPSDDLRAPPLHGSSATQPLLTPGAAAAAADALHGQVLADAAALEAEQAAASAPAPAEGVLFHFVMSRQQQVQQQQRMNPDDDCVDVPITPLTREMLAKWQVDVGAATAAMLDI